MSMLNNILSLYNNAGFYMMSLSGVNSYDITEVWVVNSSGNFTSNYVTYTIGFRPVINLKVDTRVVEVEDTVRKVE